MKWVFDGLMTQESISVYSARVGSPPVTSVVGETTIATDRRYVNPGMWRQAEHAIKAMFY